MWILANCSDVFSLVFYSFIGFGWFGLIWFCFGLIWLVVNVAYFLVSICAPFVVMFARVQWRQLILTYCSSVALLMFL
jgi:hypothetical protein